MTRRCRLNVLLVGDYKPHIGGLARYVEALKHSLSERGHGVYIFQSSYFGEDDLINNVFRMPPRLLSRIRLAIWKFPSLFKEIVCKGSSLILYPMAVFYVAALYGRVMEILSRKNVDIIHSMHLSPRSLVSIIAASDEGIPVVVSAHGYDTLAPRSIRTYRMRRDICCLAEALTVPTEAKRRRLESLYRRDFLVMSNCIPADFTYFKTAIFENEHELFGEKLRAKRALGFSDDDILILFATRLVREKGIYELLDAFRQLLYACEVSSRVRLVITGDGAERENVRARVESDATISRSIHLRFRLGYEELKTVYAASDIFAFPTRWSETIPMAIVEAMAHGVPTVTGDFEGVDEVVADGHDGFVIDPRDVDSLAARLCELVRDGGLRMRMGWNGYRKFVERFECGVVVSKLERLYKGTIGRKLSERRWVCKRVHN